MYSNDDLYKEKIRFLYLLCKIKITVNNSQGSMPTQQTYCGKYFPPTMQLTGIQQHYIVDRCAVMDQQPKFQLK